MFVRMFANVAHIRSTSFGFSQMTCSNDDCDMRFMFVASEN